MNQILLYVLHLTEKKLQSEKLFFGQEIELASNGIGDFYRRTMWLQSNPVFDAFVRHT